MAESPPDNRIPAGGHPGGPRLALAIALSLAIMSVVVGMGAFAASLVLAGLEGRNAAIVVAILAAFTFAADFGGVTVITKLLLAGSSHWPRSTRIAVVMGALCTLIPALLGVGWLLSTGRL